MKIVHGNNKYNIITDEDIIITSNKHNTGDNLKNILDSYGDDIEKLKGNVKFIYKYGGVGNGRNGNGGNGNYDNNSIYAALDGDKLTDEKQIILNSTNGTKHVLKLAAKGELSGVSYTVKVKYDNKSYNSSIFLNESNSWSTEIEIDLTINGNLQIEYTNMLTLNIESISVPYIVKAYTFDEIKYYSEDNTTQLSQNGEIFRSDFEKYGLSCISNYSIYLDGTIRYTWTFDDVKEKEVVLQVNSNSNGQIAKIISKDVDLTDGSHSLKLDITFQSSNSSSVIVLPTITTLFTILSDELSYTILPSNTVSKFFNDNSVIPSEEESFRNGEPINLQIRVYQGHTQSRTGNIHYSINDEEEKNIQFQEGDYCSITIVPQLDKTGWIVFKMDFALGSFSNSITKYLYVTVNETSYTWWADINNGLKNNILDISNGGTYYYRSPQERKGNMPFSNIIKNSSELTSTVFNNDVSNNSYDSFIIHLGIQYSKNNDETKEIAVLDTKDTEGTTNGLYIYQNKIKLNTGLINPEVSYFLEEESLTSYDPNIVSQYHLISIALRAVAKQGTSKKYELSVYLDGVLENTYENFLNGSFIFNKISFTPGNYAINLIEVAYINGEYIKNFDFDITYYYYTYALKKCNKATTDSALVTLMHEMANDNIKLKNGLLNLSADSVSAILQKSEIPSLIVRTYSGDGDRKHSFMSGSNKISIKNIYTWLNTAYDEKTEGQGTGIKDYQLILDTVRYFTPNSNKYELTSVAYKNDDNSNTDESSFFISDDETEKSGEKFVFVLELQGSSTMGFKGKNFTLGITDNTNSNRKYLFSPNFSSQDKTTFLHEEKFNLKADIVDSSHTNNVCMGNFINDNSEIAIGNDNHWFTNMISNRITSDFQRGFTKKCLTGFPIFLFLEINEGNDASSDYYLLGIYNFNLGRSSDFNLGYKDIKSFLNGGNNKQDSALYEKLTSENFKTPENKFSIISCANDSNYVDGFITAEIQGNTSLWDFSQYGKTILFQGNYKSNFMFGDIKKSATLNTVYESNIQKMVESVSRAGAFIFKTIGKKAQDIKLSTDGLNAENYYSIPGVVPSVEYQYKRTSENTFILDDEVNNNLTNGVEGSYIENIKEDSLINCIYTDTQNNIHRKINYESLVFYYTTCMAFGLVDSVQKNLTIKTWNAETSEDMKSVEFGTFFYDMDTCLGLANNGSETDYFCFSDYYKTLTEENEELNVNDVKGSIILRDYFPQKEYKYIDNSTNEVKWEITTADKEKLKGYDIPSSYLFAIAKYAWSCLGGTESDEYISTNPSELWYNLRQSALINADNFINKYFKSYTEKIHECLWNMNYRAKYLSLLNINNTEEGWVELNNNMSTLPVGYSKTNITPFKGRRLYRVKNWLNNRIHLLDFYFNINVEAAGNVADSSLPITTSENFIIKETRPVNTDNTNSDIIITNGIFGDSTNGIQRSSEVNFTVQAEDYSPLIIRNASNYFKYILTDSEIKYHFNINFTGSQRSCFSGASSWTYLDSLDTFISSLSEKDQGITINSDKLTSIIATQKAGGLSGEWNINANKVQTISLTSSNFKGSLKVNSENLNNLSSIDISNTGISLNINGQNMHINELKANNLNNAQTLTITNAETINKISLSGTIENATITSWDENSNFTINGNDGLNVKILTINARTNFKNGILTIKNNSALKQINFKGFKEVHIINCQNLTSAICNDNEASNNLNIVEINGTKIQSFSCPCNNLTSLNLYSNLSLDTLQLKGENASNLSKLDIRSTKISTIKWDESEFNTQYEDEDKNKCNVLNLKKCYYNITLSASNNTTIQYVQLKNDITKINENISNFKGCTNLKRIFGCFRIKSEMFYGCKKFSIFGVKVKQWKNKDILENKSRIKHPYELLNTNGNLEYNNYQTDLENRCFTTGDFVTNAYFAENISSCCYSTACTIFDIYYAFYIGKNITNAFQSFRGINPPDNNLNADTLPYYRWFWAKENGIEAENPMNKYMFKNCPNLTNLQLAFLGLYKGYIRISDDLLKPLTNLKSIRYNFIGGNFIISQNMISENKNITDVSYFNAKYITGDYNPFDLKYDDLESISTLYKVTKGELGKFTKLLKNLNKVTSLAVFLYSCDFLNYEDGEWQNKIPSNVTILTRCFNAKQAVGVYPLKLKNWFTSSQNIKNIDSSFMVFNSNQDLNLSYIDEYDEEVNLNQEEVTMEITNSFFDGFNNLEKLSYSSAIGDYQINNSHISSFNGNGLYKIIKDEFPYDIFSNLKKLKICTAFFMNTHSTVQDIELPLTLFKNNTELTTLDYTFCNVQFNYTLSETAENTNFTNCSKISSIKYLFADNIPIDFSSDSSNFLYNSYDNLTNQVVNQPHSSGIIPKMFFYHGNKQHVAKTFYGTNDEEEYKSLKENNELITNEWKNNNKETLEYDLPYTNITNMEGCFMHCNFDEYSCEYNGAYTEFNPNYKPFKYSYENSLWKTYEEQGKKVTYIWAYDGYNLPTSIDNIEIIDEIDTSDELNNGGFDWWNSENYLNTCDLNFFCPPDLFRYCNNSETLNIKYVFWGCGLSLSSYWQISYSQLNSNKYGIRGRIPPYLFKPIDKVKDISGLFKDCKLLSGYSTTNSNKKKEYHFIPLTLFSYGKNITTFEQTFEGLHIPSKTMLGSSDASKNFMYNLKSNNLNIHKMFFRCLWGGSSNKENEITVSNLFTNKTITYLTDVFSQTESDSNLNPTSTWYGNMRSGYVNFSDGNFNPNVYTNIQFNNNIKYKRAYAGFSTSLITFPEKQDLIDSNQSLNYASSSSLTHYTK